MIGDHDYVRDRVKKGVATKWERHWLWCIDGGRGWRHPLLGPYASEFVDDYPARAEQLGVTKGAVSA